jgi:hypothetical protein
VVTMSGKREWQPALRARRKENRAENTDIERPSKIGI